MSADFAVANCTHIPDLIHRSSLILVVWVCMPICFSMWKNNGFSIQEKDSSF